MVGPRGNLATTSLPGAHRLSPGTGWPEKKFPADHIKRTWLPGSDCKSCRTGQVVVHFVRYITQILISKWGLRCKMGTGCRTRRPWVRESLVAGEECVWRCNLTGRSLFGMSESFTPLVTCVVSLSRTGIHPRSQATARMRDRSWRYPLAQLRYV